MGRPRKLTLDFFLHDAHARSDRKIRALKRKHGNDGYAMYFQLLEMLCAEDGIKLNISHPLDAETCAEDCGLRDEAQLYAILETCVELGLFNAQLWRSERTIFSDGLYDRYLSRLEDRQAEAKKKRRRKIAVDLQARIESVEAVSPTVRGETPQSFPRGKTLENRGKTNRSQNEISDLRIQIPESDLRGRDLDPRSEQQSAKNEPTPPTEKFQSAEAAPGIASSAPKTVLESPGLIASKHCYPEMDSVGLGHFWVGQGQSGPNRFKAFAEPLIEGAVKHLQRHELPCSRGDAIGCIVNAIRRQDWAKLITWNDLGLPKPLPEEVEVLPEITLPPEYAPLAVVDAWARGEMQGEMPESVRLALLARGVAA